MTTTKILVLTMLFLIVTLTTTVSTANDLNSNSEKKLNIPEKKTENIFLKNVGQLSNADVLFQGPDVYFLKNSLSFHARIEEENIGTKNPKAPVDFSVKHEEKTSGVVWNLFFRNNDQNATVIGVGEKKTVYNYINKNGNFPNIPGYNSIQYLNAFDRADIEYYHSENGFEYDVIMHPGANVNNIQFEYKGIKGLAINPSGQLEIIVGYDLMTMQYAPYAYQKMKDGKVKEISSRYKIIDNNTYGFELGDYDKSLDVIIDPFFRKWSTYLNALSDAYSYDHAVDNQGNVYLTGWIQGDYPTTAGLYTANYVDAYVAKLSSDGSSLIYFTLIGGSNREEGNGIDVDNAGAAYITGWTQSFDFPVSSTGFGTAYSGGGFDAFITKLTPAGNGIVYSRLIGGSAQDEANDIIVDKNTLVPYITGRTSSSNFPVTSSVAQTSLAGGFDAFIIAIDPNINALNPVYSTYFGGSGDDVGKCLFRTPADILYIAGSTRSTGLATPGVFQTVNNNVTYTVGDGFVAEFTPNCVNLNRCTYIGGSLPVNINDIDINAGGIYIAGATYDGTLASIHFPVTAGALQTTVPATAIALDGFVTRLKSDLSPPLIYSTYLGGSSDAEEVTDVKANGNNEVYVAGWTESSNFPTTSNNFQTSIGGYADIFLANINAAGNAFGNGGSTFIGGTYPDYHTPKITLSTGCTDTLVINGTTHSPNFPVTPGAYQPVKVNLVGLNVGDQPIVMKFSVDTCVLLGEPTGSIGDLSYEDTICLGSCWNITAPVLSGNPTLSVGSYQSTYIHINGSGQLEVNVCNLDTGRHMFMCQVNGTSTPFVIYVTVQASPDPVHLGPDRLLCSGSSVTLSTPSQTGITYSWIGPNNFSSTSSHVSISQPGTYIITATNGLGCSVSDTVNVSTLDDMPNTFVTYNNCYVSNGVQLNAGNGALTYSWSPSTGLSNPTISNPVANPSVTTTYTVIATFSGGCVDTGDVVVTVPPVPVYSIGSALTVCKGSCVKLNVPGNIPCIKSAIWYFSSGDGSAPSPTGNETIGSGNTLCIVPTASGHYCVRIIDCNGCEYTLCRSITVLSGRSCKGISTVSNECCNISTQRLSIASEASGVALFAVYPNPVKDHMLQLSYEVGMNDHIRIILMNSLGQVQSELLNETATANTAYTRSIDISKLSSGIYFLSLESASITKTIKFVKQ